MIVILESIKIKCMFDKKMNIFVDVIEVENFIRVFINFASFK